MRLGKRISHLLLLMILCVLIIYVGFYTQIEFEDNEVSMRISRYLTDCSGKMYLTGLYYQEEDTTTVGKWIAAQAVKMIPIGSYVQEHKMEETEKEDEWTIERILANQENDEEKIIENNDRENLKAATVEKVSIDKLKDFEYLIHNFYTVDASTVVTENDLNAEKLLKKDMRIKKNQKNPQVLIYHTHSQEAFKDSKKGKTKDTIMGMGEYLAKLLNEKYGIPTLHHEGVYDLIDGKLDRSKAYQMAEPQIKKILSQNPEIEVVIDLHRDGVKESTHLATEIDGKQTAQIMFFNGMSKTKANGEISYLHNPYKEDNLAFSLQMQLYAAEKFPGLTRRIYLKSYRYNMHLMPKSLLIEAGAQTNTVEEMRNSMEFLAQILYGVLTEEKKFD